MHATQTRTWENALPERKRDEVLQGALWHAIVRLHPPDDLVSALARVFTRVAGVDF